MALARCAGQWENLFTFSHTGAGWQNYWVHSQVRFSFCICEWTFFWLFVTSCWCPNFPLIIYLCSCSSHPTYVDMISTHCFCVVVVVVFLLILPDVDSMHFVTFFTACKTSSNKIWFVLPSGLAENLTQVAFRQPFVIQHVRIRLLSCENWNFWCFYTLISMNSICDLWYYSTSSCCIRVISWF